ncbi:hypothetical protein Vretimale_12314 [Volvox reticuliferus]|uniref:RNA-editing substrate-binding complex 6 protein domain-containing protein n=1 Tax=Volvox reticuliferus TaxID=1737510 RepID=A0A8J4FPY4_9CHLO|nr:hypothetical protein Vretifemale_8872 [Volvox reticuliferus]GIM08229.1 hypothetical protein Vretimale_12314 [Volvox reticuliferus]
MAMEFMGRASVSRIWRSTHKSPGLPRGCCVRIVAFNEERRAPPGAPPAPAPTATSTTDAVARSVYKAPLSAQNVDTLPSAVLATSFAEYAQQVALERTGDGNSVTAPAFDSRIFDALARRLARDAYDFDANPLVDILHACSRAGQGHRHRDVLAMCCAVLTGKVEELQPASLARLASSCAGMDLQATELFAALCARAGEPDVLLNFSVEDLATLLVALSQLQHRSPALYGDAADILSSALQLATGTRPSTAARQSVMLTAEQAVSVVWALAAAGLYHRPLFDAAGSLLMDRLIELDGNALAKVAWSYATVRSADESHRALWDRDLFESIARICLARGVVGFPPRALVTLLWSFASIPHYDGPLFDAVASGLAPHMAAGAVSPSDMVAVAWSVMRVSHAHVDLMEALGDAALAAVDQMDGDDLTTIALAFPAAKSYSEAFFKYLVSEAQERPQRFGQVALLDIIRLISRVQHRDPKYYGSALKVLLEHVHKAFLDAPVDKTGCMNPFRFG